MASNLPLDELLIFTPTLLEKTKLRSGVLMTVGGTFQRAETENANKRIYPKDLWSKILKDKGITTKIEDRQMVGCLSHPASGQTDPEKISHIVTKQELLSDNTVYGEADILDTPMGRITATLFDAGAKIGISSRGDGTLEKKGDYSTVQNDYQLETYDFVLKPSTPGAYPGIIENIEENEKLVAEAIEGLVNSDLPEDQRIPVLAECLKILSILEADNSGGRIKTLTEKLTEVLKADAPEVIVGVTAKESIDPQEPEGTSEKGPQENEMGIPKKNDPVQLEISADTLAWHQSQVSKAVSEIEAQKDQELDKIKDTVIRMEKRISDKEERIAAAEEIIDEFQTEIKRLKETSDNADIPIDEELQERYAASVELLDEALRRLPELGVAQRRITTLESLLEAAIDRAKSEKVDEAVEENLARLPRGIDKEQAKKLFENCSNVAEVSEQFEALSKITGIGSRRIHEPLPGGPINEGNLPNKKPKRDPMDENFTQRLNRRLVEKIG